jgi:predicted phage-related endonuclease
MSLHNGIPHGTDAWYAARENTIGASEIGAVLGKDRYMSPVQLFMRKKMEKKRRQQKKEPPHRDWGTDVEPAILTNFARRHGYELMPSPGWLPHPTLAIGCTADGLGVKGGQIRVIQAKNIEEHHVREWGEPGTAEAPLSYVAQVTLEVGILRAHDDAIEGAGDIAACFGGRPPLGYPIPFNAELFGNLAQAAERFVRNYLIPNKPPPLEGDRAALEYVKRRWGTSTGELLEPTDKARELVVKLRELKAAGASAETDAEQLQAQLCALIGEAYGFEGLCTWGVVKEQRRTVINWPMVCEYLAGKAGLSRDEVKGLVTSWTTEEVVKESYRRLTLAKERKTQ